MTWSNYSIIVISLLAANLAGTFQFIYFLTAVFNATSATPKPNAEVPGQTIWGMPEETQLWPSIVLLTTACISTALSICISHLLKD